MFTAVVLETRVCFTSCCTGTEGYYIYTVASLALVPGTGAGNWFLAVMPGDWGLGVLCY